MTRAKYNTEQFVQAIPGTGGIISAIASRVGCSWHTAKKYIERHQSIQQAYQDELESTIDVAESVVMGNIQMAFDKLGSEEYVDSADAKWFLSRRGRHRGYTTKAELDITAKAIDLTRLSDDQLRRIADGEDVELVLATSSQS